MSDEEYRGIPSAQEMHSTLQDGLKLLDEQSADPTADLTAAVDMVLQALIAEALMGIKHELESLNGTLRRYADLWYRGTLKH